MALNDRNPIAGTQLAARYKKELYRCTVVETEGGLRFRLCDFTKVETGYQRQTGSAVDFKTPSAAGAAVLGGMACNGWRFWTLASELDAPKERKAAAVAPIAPAADDTATTEGEAAPEATAGPTEPAVDGTPDPVHDEQNPKAFKVITRMKKQDDAPEGMTKYWCKACMNPFTAPADVEPAHCPNGHLPETVNGELVTVEVAATSEEEPVTTEEAAPAE